MTVTVLYFEGCPHWRTADGRLRESADECGFDVDRRIVDTPDAAEQMRFRGSPTILVDGLDPFASGDEPVGLSCRVYDTPDGPAGAPTVEQLRDVLC
jgi:hypothetical protein